jgi:hypothetical protein
MGYGLGRALVMSGRSSVGAPGRFALGAFIAFGIVSGLGAALFRDDPDR